MKKIILRIILAVICICFLSLPVFSSEYEFGAGEEYTDMYPEDEMDALISNLPEEVKNEISDFIKARDDSDRYDALSDKLSFSYWVKYAAREVKELFMPKLCDFAGMLCLILSCAAVSHISALHSGGGGAGEICSLVVTLVSALSVTGAASSAANLVESYISRICAMMNAMLPVMNAVMISSGTLTQMSVNSSALMLYITVTENIFRMILIPASGALLALSTVSGVFKKINIGSFISSIKNIVTKALMFSMLIFSFILGVQSSLARSADGLASRTVKFVLGSSVPIVGGAVSEAITTVSSALSLIRKMTGSIGIIIILLIVLPTLINLTLNRALFSLCRSVSELLGCDEMSRIISDADSVLAIFAGAAAVTAVLFVFAVTLFMNSGLT
ncbi:MAG: hypothetical protein HFE30_02140 [Clostridiales bacterium]|nr:hypothetical protein [Clostridiales bacterium]